MNVPVPKYTKWRGIAGRLNFAQIQMVMQLFGPGGAPQLLGCSEVTAARLSRKADKRPALTYTVQPEGSRWPMWHLTEEGERVKEALRDMLEELLR